MFRKMVDYYYMLKGPLSLKKTEENIEELYEPRLRRICKENEIPFIPFVFTGSTLRLFHCDMYTEIDRKYIDFCKKFSSENNHNGDGFLI